MGFHGKDLNTLYGLNALNSIADALGEIGINEKEIEQKLKEIQNLSWKEIEAKYGSIPKELRKFIKNRGKEDKDYTRKRVGNILELFGDKKISNYLENSRLRPYQKELLANIITFLFSDIEKSGYIHSATSTGKAVMFGELINTILKITKNQKVLIAVPTKAAYERVKDELTSLGINFGEINSKKKNSNSQVTIGTVGVLRGMIETNKISKSEFDLLVCDEIHNTFLGEKTSKIVDYFACKKIGFTATPELLEKSVENLFPKKIGEYLVDEAIMDEFLPRVDDSIQIEIDDTEMSKLEKDGKDYTKKSLGKMKLTDIYPKVIDTLKGKLRGKSIAIFLPNIESSKELSALLNEAGISSAHVDGTTKAINSIKNGFENGEPQIICSCDVLSESWDSDKIDGVMILRPTLSPAKYQQMVGRALHGKQINPLGEKIRKNKVHVVDLVSSKRDILARNISIRGIASLINYKGEGSGGNGPNRAKIKKIWIGDSTYINETLMYYDFINLWDEKYENNILEAFCKAFGEDKVDFIKNLRSNQQSKYYNRKERVKIEMISNNYFGKSYSGRKQTLEVDFKTFFTILNSSKTWKMVYKNAFPKEFEKIDINSIVDLLGDKDPSWIIYNENHEVIQGITLKDIIDFLSKLIRGPFLQDEYKRVFCKHVLSEFCKKSKKRNLLWKDIVDYFQKSFMEVELFDDEKTGGNFGNFSNKDYDFYFGSLTIETLQKKLKGKSDNELLKENFPFHIYGWNDFLDDVLSKKIGIDLEIKGNQARGQERLSKLMILIRDSEITSWEELKSLFIKTFQPK